jgi:hypothetical protein
VEVIATDIDNQRINLNHVDFQIPVMFKENPWTNCAAPTNE